MTWGESYFETCPLWVYLFCSCVIGTLACWPIFLTGSVFIFFDTSGYLTNGAAISQVLSGQIDTGAGNASVGGGGTAAVADKGRSIRSMVFSAFAHFGSSTPLGPAGPMVAQSAFVASLALLLIPNRALHRPIMAVLALVAIILLTPWPFYASLFMPDLLSAGMVLGAMVLVKGTNRRGFWSIGLVTAFAAMSHYGNFPFAISLAGSVGLWFVMRRRLTWAVTLTLALPLVATVAVNMLGGVIAFGEKSVAPRRLPILLARSLADGPARWHLQEKCDIYNYEVCTALKTLPDNVGAALWQDGGLAKIASVEVLDRIRAEESILLWRAFLDYPGAQSWSLLRNAALQMLRFGLSDVYGGSVMTKADGTYVVKMDKEQYRATFDRLEWLHMVVVLLALVVVLEAVVRRRVTILPMVAIMFLGFSFNAGIFGGLSAPVDRYQGRIIWILPALAALIMLSRQADDGKS